MLPLTFKRKPGDPSALFAVIDDTETWAIEIAWSAQRTSTGRFYAVKKLVVNGRCRTFYLHREIVEARPGVEVDHRNGDPLDCRRENLRVATHRENSRNVTRPNANTSGFKGVRRVETKTAGVRWYAYIKTGGRQRVVGTFDSPESAGRAYDEAALVLFGEFARLNFPARSAA